LAEDGLSFCVILQQDEGAAAGGEFGGICRKSGGQRRLI
jgi:hypothetical protein